MTDTFDPDGPPTGRHAIPPIVMGHDWRAARAAERYLAALDEYRRVGMRVFRARMDGERNHHAAEYAAARDRLIEAEDALRMEVAS